MALRKSYKMGRKVDRFSQATTRSSQPGSGGLKPNNVAEVGLGLITMGGVMIFIVVFLGLIFSIFGG